jgi:hypothetical protein
MTLETRMMTLLWSGAYLEASSGQSNCIAIEAELILVSSKESVPDVRVRVDRVSTWLASDFLLTFKTFNGTRRFERTSTRSATGSRGARANRQTSGAVNQTSASPFNAGPSGECFAEVVVPSSA